jgi:hypothetical protein
MFGLYVSQIKPGISAYRKGWLIKLARSTQMQGNQGQWCP